MLSFGQGMLYDRHSDDLDGGEGVTLRAADRGSCESVAELVSQYPNDSQLPSDHHL